VTPADQAAALLGQGAARLAERVLELEGLLREARGYVSAGGGSALAMRIDAALPPAPAAPPSLGTDPFDSAYRELGGEG
jgi:hypothetical protein